MERRSIETILATLTAAEVRYLIAGGGRVSAHDDPREWPRGWEAAELAQLRRRAALSLREKLEWLEEAQRLAAQMERARAADATRRPGSGGA